VFVLDSSVALAMLMPDEQSAAADELASRFAEGSVAVPIIWPLEVRNALLAALRSRRITAAEFDERLEVLALLPVEVSPPPDVAALKRTVALARRHDLSIYDASYVDLAKQRALPLATLDSKLRKACGALRVAVLP
jgi:predicted nucleic acid-binding protein